MANNEEMVNKVITDDLDSLNLDEDEDEALAVTDDILPLIGDHSFVLVGTFISKAVIYLEAMRTALAEYWKPECGVEITALGENRYLFEFFHEVDLLNVFEGGPFHFNNHLLVLHRLKEGEDPMTCPLYFVNMWVQVYNLLPGSFSEGMAKLLGNFVGRFVEYDAQSLTRGNREYMRIRVRIDIRLPLKRKKKIAFGRDREGYVNFKYEKLKLFCFLCGKIGHHDRSCPRHFQPGGRELPLEWGVELRAPVRRQIPTSQYLRVGGQPILKGKLGTIPGEDQGKIFDSNPKFGSLLQGDNSGNNSKLELNKENLDPMEHDTEDNSVMVVDGHKRPRNALTSQVSDLDSTGVINGSAQAHSQTVSAGLGIQARRAQ